MQLFGSLIVIGSFQFEVLNSFAGILRNLNGEFKSCIYTSGIFNELASILHEAETLLGTVSHLFI